MINKNKKVKGELIMDEKRKQNLENHFALIRSEAKEKRRIEAERQQKLKELFDRSKSNDPFERIKGEIK